MDYLRVFQQLGRVGHCLKRNAALDTEHGGLIATQATEKVISKESNLQHWCTAAFVRHFARLSLAIVDPASLGGFFTGASVSGGNFGGAACPAS